LVSVIDMGAYAVAATIKVGRCPLDIAVDPATHSVYVLNDDDSLSVIDTKARTVTASIKLNGRVHDVAVDSTTHVYVTDGLHVGERLEQTTYSQRWSCCLIGQFASTESPAARVSVGCATCVSSIHERPEGRGGALAP
jgi:YVTN family beta-propeller protein